MAQARKDHESLAGTSYPMKPGYHMWGQRREGVLLKAGLLQPLCHQEGSASGHKTRTKGESAKELSCDWESHPLSWSLCRACTHRRQEEPFSAKHRH